MVELGVSTTCNSISKNRCYLSSRCYAQRYNSKSGSQFLLLMYSLFFKWKGTALLQQKTLRMVLHSKSIRISKKPPREPCTLQPHYSDYIFISVVGTENSAFPELTTTPDSTKEYTYCTKPTLPGHKTGDSLASRNFPSLPKKTSWQRGTAKVWGDTEAICSTKRVHPKLPNKYSKSRQNFVADKQTRLTHSLRMLWVQLNHENRRVNGIVEHMNRWFN